MAWCGQARKAKEGSRSGRPLPTPSRAQSPTPPRVYPRLVFTPAMPAAKGLMTDGCVAAGSTRCWSVRWRSAWWGRGRRSSTGPTLPRGRSAAPALRSLWPESPCSAVPRICSADSADVCLVTQLDMRCLRSTQSKSQNNCARLLVSAELGLVACGAQESRAHYVQLLSRKLQKHRYELH